MVWGGISWDGRTDLIVLDKGTLITQWYVEEILDLYVRLYDGAAGNDFMVMDDNARLLKIRVATKTGHQKY